MSAFIGCDFFRRGGGGTAHERYASGLKRSGLDSSAMGRKWLDAARQSLARPLGISLPYREEGYFAPDRPRAVCYRLSLQRGQQVHISLVIRPAMGARLFAELFRPSGTNRPPLAVDEADTGGRLSYEAEEDGDVFLRLQPELLAAVSYSLTITTAPSLAFPVSGGHPSDIGSVWGAPRDAGARRHEGVDIFGRRGTPVVAAAAGLVTRTGEGGIGGKVVWMKPSGRNFSLYYAHLDAQLVGAGERVRQGDTLGLMGNTGNARTTPPHLHFGIYGQGGAVDPLPFIRPDTREPPAIRGSTEVLNTRGRTRNAGELQTDPSSKMPGIRLPQFTPVTIDGLAGAYYIVSLTDGRNGFLPVNAVDALTPVGRSTLRSPAVLVHQAEEGGAIAGRLAAGNTVEILARQDGFMLVRYRDMHGWLREQETR